MSIHTYYLGPTNLRGSRIKAVSSGRHAITLAWDDRQNPEDNHKMAARMLIEKLGWGHHAWFSGGATEGGTVWVCALPDAGLAFCDSQEQWIAQSPREFNITAALSAERRNEMIAIGRIGEKGVGK